MTTSNHFGSTVLTWVQPKMLKQTYELRLNDTPVAWLKNLSSWSGKAIAQDDRNYFAFERKGFWKTRVIALSKEGATIASFTGRSYGRGTLELANGRRFQWKQTSFWGSKWAWLDEQGLMLVQFKSKGGWHKVGEVEVTALGQHLPELSLLTLLGGYLIVYMRNSSSSS